jgi:protein phosphatase
MMDRLESMSREQLLAAIKDYALENSALREQIRSIDTSTVPQVFKPSASGRAYDISFNVMVIENGTPDMVPISQVLNKSYLRPDQREADTPVVGADGQMGSLEGRGSMEGRLSSYSIGSVESPHMMRASTGSFGSPELGGMTSEPSAAPHQGGMSSNGRLKLDLKIGRPQSLDPDAIVSHHTLHEFNRLFAGQGGAMSPMSNYGSSIYRYLTDIFVKQNNFSHATKDIEGFGRTLINLCGEVEVQLRQEPRHAPVASPCYVFGDIHGNFRDLHYFMSSLITFGDLRYTPHRFVFLGDYVDRGEFSVEVTAFLFAVKLIAPEKIILLRGNHEDTLVSGDLSSYGATSFRAQCRSLFGAIVGEEVWKRASRAFAYLPLTANIDGKIFCTHGGLPRFRGGVDNRMDLLMRPDFPVYESFFQIPERESAESQMYRQAATDTCWSDPADDESSLDAHGFGPNPRGNGVILFGSRAVDQFLERYGYEFIFRAHQEKSDGLKLSKSAKVFTIFSTSAYVGHQNGAGVVLVADGKIRLIIKNPDSTSD